MNQAAKESVSPEKIEELVQEKYEEYLKEGPFDIEKMKPELKEVLKKIFIGGFRYGMQYLLEKVKTDAPWMVPSNTKMPK